MSERVARYGKAARRHRGVALITVLLIVALLSSMVVRLSFANRVWIRQMENSVAQLRAWQASRAVQNWAALILSRDDNNYDAGDEIWARPMSRLPVGSAVVQGYLEDMQGRFNLNNLRDDNGASDPAAMAQFKRLLTLLDLNPGIAEAAADWVDADSDNNGPRGAEDGAYLGMNPPYLAANKPFADAAELRLVYGVDRATWHKLRPFVSALPRRTRVNINTASAEVLAAVVSEWGTPREALPPARAWAAQTDREPLRRISVFYEKLPDFDEEDEDAVMLTVRSDFFRARASVEVDRARLLLATSYHRRRGRVASYAQRREFEW